MANKGIFEIDINMGYFLFINGIVIKLVFISDYFFNKFGSVMIKMGRIGVFIGK